MNILIGTLLFIYGVITTLIILGFSSIKELILENEISRDIREYIDKGKLRFHIRVEDTVYIKGYKNYTIVYSIKDKSISLLDGIKSISTFNKLKLSEKINKEFSKEINNVTELFGNTYSKNLWGKYDDDSTESKKKVKPQIDKEYNMDNILDQIKF